VSSYRRPAAVGRLALGLAGLTLVASGCTLASPKTITTPYQAADGTNAQVSLSGGGTVKFRDFLLVSASKGSPGVLVGAIAVDGTQPQQVRVRVLGADDQSVLGQGTVTAQPGQLTQIGPSGDTSVQVSDVPLPPGSVLHLQADTGSGGTDFSLPVLAPVNQYSTITPSAS
jgi:hypothetical protein